MRPWSFALLILVLTGCGGGGGDKPTTTTTGRVVDGSPDKAAIRAVARTYLDGVASRNWKQVCATRAAAERAELAKTAGSCEKAFATIMSSAPVALFAGAAPSAVRIKGDLAGVDIAPKGSKKKFLTLAAVRENGGWKIKDVPDAKVP